MTTDICDCMFLLHYLKKKNNNKILNFVLIRLELNLELAQLYQIVINYRVIDAVNTFSLYFQNLLELIKT